MSRAASLERVRRIRLATRNVERDVFAELTISNWGAYKYTKCFVQPENPLEVKLFESAI